MGSQTIALLLNRTEEGDCVIWRCNRCKEQINETNGIVMFLFYGLFGDNLCYECKRKKDIDRYDHKVNRMREYELEKERERARWDEKEYRDRDRW